MMRIISIVISLFAVFFSLIVFNAASVERTLASTTKQIISDSVDDSTRLAVAERLENYSNNHWSRPLVWHAGVIAQAARLQSLKSQWFPELSRQANNLGNMYAERTLKGQPTHATAWYRLADYSHMGYENTLCSGLDCLNNSWKFEPMTRDFNMACGRFKLAGLYGLRVKPDSDKVENYVASYYYQDYFKNNAYHKSLYRQKTAKCFDFLGPQELFVVLQSIN